MLACLEISRHQSMSDVFWASVTLKINLIIPSNALPNACPQHYLVAFSLCEFIKHQSWMEHDKDETVFIII